MREDKFISHDGKALTLAVWDEVKDPKAVVQIVHGMSEHIRRYDLFAKHLNSQGYIVAGDDHRAHGLTDKERHGLIEKGRDLFNDTKDDEICLTAFFKEKYKLPVMLFGHSYGSFISQAYILENSHNICACVLSGSVKQPSSAVALGQAVARLKSGKNGVDKPGKFFAKMTFGAYDKKYKEGLNGWLSRDKNSNEAYNSDPLCGFVCSNGFYKSLFDGLRRLNKNDYKTIKKDLPLMIVYGTEDPVGGYGKYVKSLIAKYRKAGLTPIDKPYENARHELTNEVQKEQFYADISQFFDSTL